MHSWSAERKNMKNIYVETLSDHIGEDIEGTFVISKITIKDGHIQFLLSDTTGEIPGFSTTLKKDCFMGLSGHVVRAKGNILVKDGKLSFFLESIEKETENLPEEDYEKSLDEETFEALRGEITGFTELVSNETLKDILKNVFRDSSLQKLRYLKGSSSWNHDYPGGLLVHTLEVVKISVAAGGAMKFPPDISFDLLISGALLHDIGKLHGFDMAGALSDEMRLIGPAVEGTLMLENLFQHYRKRAEKKEKNVDEKAFHALKHIILSSGFGKSLIQPRTIEAIIVSNADRLSTEAGAYVSAFNEPYQFDETKAYSEYLQRTLITGGTL